MTERAQNADFRSFTPSPGNSSIWRAQETAENRRFSQKTAENRRLGSVTLGASPSARPYLCPSTVRSGSKYCRYGSVAYLVETLIWETRSEQYSDTVLKTENVKERQCSIAVWTCSSNQIIFLRTSVHAV